MKKHKRKAGSKKTPVRVSLVEDSVLLPEVADGLGAVLKAHRGHFDEGIRSSFEDSLDLDAATKKGNEQAHRWDYLLGHGLSKTIVAVEPHSATQGEVSVLIKKCSDAKDQLRVHLREGVRIAKWLWVASGKVNFYSGIEKIARQLDQQGIEFVGTKVTARHLPGAALSNSTREVNKQTRKRRK
jgi:hypothetical protein